MTTPSEQVPQIPGYRDLTEIGRGGQARVYRGFNTAIGRFEAIKVYSGEQASDSSAQVRARFDHEARVTGRISHPNVIVVYRSETFDAVPCLFLEYLDGMSLRAVLDDADAVLSTEQILAVLIDIAAALDGLSAAPVPLVHRDVKPENILLERDGAGGFARAVLADFGVAVALDGSGPQGSLIGSAPYMAPEQLLRGPLSARTDQYGLACTAYELFTGRAPFTGDVLDRVSAMATHQGRAPITPPSQVDRRLSRRVDRVLTRALATEAKDRFPDATTFVSALADALGRPIGDAHRPVRRFVRRHRAATAVTAAVTIAALVTGGIAAERALVDHRDLAHPPLARPGILTGCPDLTDTGLTEIAVAGPHTGYDTLHVVGTYGEFALTADDDPLVSSRFPLDVRAVLGAGEFGAMATDIRLGVADCRYADDPEMPPDGLVLNVYTGAAAGSSTATTLGAAVRERLRLGEPHTVEIGLDGGHKARIQVWERVEAPYAVCIVQIPGQGPADVSPLLIGHQILDVPDPVCDPVEQVAADLLKKSWDSLPEEQRRVAVRPLPSRPDRDTPVDHESVLQATAPCDDHAALGLTRQGAFEHPGLVEGCWFLDGRGEPVVLGHANEDFEFTASRWDLVEADVDTLAPPAGSVTPPLTETLLFDGVSDEGRWVTTYLEPSPEFPVTPVVWVPLSHDETADPYRRGEYLQHAMVLRRHGFRFSN